MIRYTWGNKEDNARVREVYFTNFPGMYFTGDGCRKDEGRVARPRRPC